MREDLTDRFVVPKLKVMNEPEFVFCDGHTLQCELAAEALRSFGTLRLRVAGWSMVPNLWPGDILVIEIADRRAIGSGDVVLFSRHQRLVAHRVIENSSPGGVQTRGDAMRQADEPVSDRELLGRVVSIERNGRSMKPNSELNAGSRSAAALLRHLPMAKRLAVAIHEALPTVVNLTTG